MERPRYCVPGNTSQVLRLGLAFYCALSETLYLGRLIWDVVSGTQFAGYFFFAWLRAFFAAFFALASCFNA
jgi:hypothetical protein